MNKALSRALLASIEDNGNFSMSSAEILRQGMRTQVVEINLTRQSRDKL